MLFCTGEQASVTASWSTARPPARGPALHALSKRPCNRRGGWYTRFVWSKHSTLKARYSSDTGPIFLPVFQGRPSPRSAGWRRAYNAHKDPARSFLSRGAFDPASVTVTPGRAGKTTLLSSKVTVRESPGVQYSNGLANALLRECHFEEPGARAGRAIGL